MCIAELLLAEWGGRTAAHLIVNPLQHAPALPKVHSCACDTSPAEISLSPLGCAGKPGGVALAESAGWADLMKLVQRACVVVTEDMPVDPDARDLQVSHTCQLCSKS